MNDDQYIKLSHRMDIFDISKNANTKQISIIRSQMIILHNIINAIETSKIVGEDDDFH